MLFLCVFDFLQLFEFIVYLKLDQSFSLQKLIFIQILNFVFNILKFKFQILMYYVSLLLSTDNYLLLSWYYSCHKSTNIWNFSFLNVYWIWNFSFLNVYWIRFDLILLLWFFHIIRIVTTFIVADKVLKMVNRFLFRYIHILIYYLFLALF